MHELLAKIDDTTYLRIIEDARKKGIEPRDWINHAIMDYLLSRQSAVKEIPACENETCSPGTVNVHAEIYSPHPDGNCHDSIGQLQQRIRELETERDNLKMLAGQNNEAGVSVSSEVEEVLTLRCEIEKNAFELDEMEATLERLRLEKERLSSNPDDIHRIPHIEKEIERQEYEVENFREEIEKLMSTLDSLKYELAKKRRS
ncbi:MAG: hypothetical protein WCP36_07260 [Methanomicrobiales archaeon]